MIYQMKESSESLLVSSPVVLRVNPVLLNTLLVVAIYIECVIEEHVRHCKTHILLKWLEKQLVIT